MAHACPTLFKFKYNNLLIKFERDGCWHNKYNNKIPCKKQSKKYSLEISTNDVGILVIKN